MMWVHRRLLYRIRKANKMDFNIAVLFDRFKSTTVCSVHDVISSLSFKSFLKLYYFTDCCHACCRPTSPGRMLRVGLFVHGLVRGELPFAPSLICLT